MSYKDVLYSIDLLYKVAALEISVQTKILKLLKRLVRPSNLNSIDYFDERKIKVRYWIYIPIGGKYLYMCVVQK